ncbi:MAG: HAD family hydrolase [Woeseiaceae bacterium]|nr:HAD family hydrolase [Woeseiaceae bacterium]
MHAVILDIDGTLLHSAEDDDRIYREAVREVLGDVVLRADLGDYEAVTDSGILLQVLEDNDRAASEGILTDVRSVFATRMHEHIASQGPFEPLPGAREFVSRLRCSSRHAVAIATGGWGITARMKLDSAGFDIGDLPLASADDASDRAAIMRVALDALRGRFSRVTYFGDGEWDRRATRELGWRFQPVGRALGGITRFDPGRLPD